MELYPSDGRSAGRPVAAKDPNREEFPLWSADSRSRLFLRLDRQGRASVWRIGVEPGAQPERTADLGLAPDWFGFYGRIDWRDRVAWVP